MKRSTPVTELLRSSVSGSRVVEAKVVHLSPVFCKISLSIWLGFGFSSQIVPFGDTVYWRRSVLLLQACLWKMSLLP